MSKLNADPVKVTAVGQETQATTTSAMGAAASDETEQLVFTLRTATGEVLKVEKVDPTGKRSEVPLDEPSGSQEPKILKRSTPPSTMLLKPASPACSIRKLKLRSAMSQQRT